MLILCAAFKKLWFSWFRRWKKLYNTFHVCVLYISAKPPCSKCIIFGVFT